MTAPAAATAAGIDVLVLGAGVAGLVAARRLRDAGARVVVVDKGRAVGGRTASRRLGDARHDQGAQFVTLQHDEVRDLTDALRALGALATWFHGAPDVEHLPAGDVGASTDEHGGHPRFRGAPSSRAPAEVLAATLPDVRLATEVARLDVAGRRWVATTGHGDRITATALVCTAPAPQTTALLEGLRVAGRLRTALDAVVYEPCWTVLARPDGRPALPASGAARIDDAVIAFLADEQRKGTSRAPAVTIHSTGPWAVDHLDDDPSVVGETLAATAARMLSVGLTVEHVHRWRYATPVEHGDDPGPVGDVTGDDGTSAPLALAGDGYVGGRVEGAMRSGHVAATRLAARIGLR